MPPGLARLRRNHPMITAGQHPKYSCRSCGPCARERWRRGALRSWLFLLGERSDGECCSSEAALVCAAAFRAGADGSASCRGRWWVRPADFGRLEMSGCASGDGLDRCITFPVLAVWAGRGDHGPDALPCWRMAMVPRDASTALINGAIQRRRGERRRFLRRGRPRHGSSGSGGTRARTSASGSLIISLDYQE